MKYARLVLANLARKKVRTLLAVGSFFVALFLFGVLATLNFTFGMGTEIASAERLAVINRVSLIQPLPVAYKEQIAALPGVARVTHANWFGGVYQDPKNFIAQFAVEPEALFGACEHEVPVQRRACVGLRGAVHRRVSVVTPRLVREPAHDTQRARQDDQRRLAALDDQARWIAWITRHDLRGLTTTRRVAVTLSGRGKPHLLRRITRLHCDARFSRWISWAAESRV